jgi:hypothetical protein
LDGNDIIPSSILVLGDGLINLPSFTGTEMLDIQYLSTGMLIYDLTDHVIRYYNGNSWQPLNASVLALPVSGLAAMHKDGVAINQSFKHPSSVLDINASGGKAFQLPKVNPVDMYAPVAGLICFNPSNQKLMVYDGLHWNILQ